MQQTSMYAAGANPTLVQNDEHILVKGHRPGHGIVRVYKWGMGCDTEPGYASWHQCEVFLLAGLLCPTGSRCIWLYILYAPLDYM